MIRVSASSVERQLACPGSAHLPQHDYSTAAAAAGSDRHEDAEIAALLGGIDDLPWQVRKLLEPGDVLSAECAMAYDVSDNTARALGHISWRDYAPHLRPFEIPMTIDLIVHGERRILVVDYKGYRPVTPAAVNPQLLTGALAVARASGRDEITVAIVYLGASWLPADVATLGVFEFDMHAGALRAMVASSDRSLHAGPHCEYCHAFLSCPEQRALAVRAGDGQIAVRVEAMIPFDDDAEASEAYDLYQRIRVVATRMRAALAARAAERPIPLGGGRFFGRVDKQGNERLDGDMVHAVVTELHDRDTADLAVTRSATKVRLEAALKGKRGAVKKVLDVVRERGGATRNAGSEICEYTAGPRLVTSEDGAPKQLTEAVTDSPF